MNFIDKNYILHYAAVDLNTGGSVSIDFDVELFDTIQIRGRRT